MMRYTIRQVGKMEYFLVDYDKEIIVGMYEDSIADLQQFIRDLDESYGDSWFDNLVEAQMSVEEYYGVSK